MRKLWQRFSNIFTLCALLCLVIVCAHFFIIIHSPLAKVDKATAEQPIIITVKSGTSARHLSMQLYSDGYLTHPLYFELLSRLFDNGKQLKAGQYALTQTTSPWQLLQAMHHGDAYLHKLTIVEGWTFRELYKAIQQDENITKTLSKLSAEAIAQRLKIPATTPEGYLLPETYKFPATTTDAAFLERAFQKMQTLLTNAWAERDISVPFGDPYEALIAASLIEKETARDDERDLVAAVIVNRLRKNMRLQIDPTVIYGLGKAYTGNITHADLKRNTPYNTYVHKGLPPTPIAFPSQQSIHAALHPAASDYLYFVARGDGSHVFAKTLAEQEKNVTKYQKTKSKPKPATPQKPQSVKLPAKQSKQGIVIKNEHNG